MPTIVKIENTYADRSNTETVTVDSPANLAQDVLEDWWEDVVFPHTGDGNGESEYAVYEATVIESDVADLVGLTNEWDG